MKDSLTGDWLFQIALALIWGLWFNESGRDLALRLIFGPPIGVALTSIIRRYAWPRR